MQVAIHGLPLSKSSKCRTSRVRFCHALSISFSFCVLVFKLGLLGCPERRTPVLSCSLDHPICNLDLGFSSSARQGF